MLNIFGKNSMQFGFFPIVLSIDELMIKYSRRNSLKQFIKCKSIMFGIKMWALHSIEGYLFDCEISDFLPNCTQRSSIVPQISQKLFIIIPYRTLF